MMLSIIPLYNINADQIDQQQYMISKSVEQSCEHIYRKVAHLMKKNKESDLFSKAFLRPQQIVFKTWKTENDKKKPEDSLPYGLKQVVKKNISLNKYVLQDFRAYSQLQPFQRNINYLRNNNYDNLISLLKPSDAKKNIQVCICICMYSQDKTMLRKTLAGVSNNIITFSKNGVPADQILVVVVMDGIEKVDASVVDFFTELEKESNIYLDDEVQPVDTRGLVEQQVSLTEQQELININSFIFDQFELSDRKRRRFAQRKKEYQEIKGMISKIQNYEKSKTITFDDLDIFLRPFFVEKARQQKRKQCPDQNLDIDNIPQQKLIEEFTVNTKRSRPIIFKALSEAKKFCQTYISSRDDLALLNSFRVQVNSGAFSQMDHENFYEGLIQQQAKGSIKMNLLFLTKYKNSGKLSSHNWFFNGICKQINSQYAVLLDVGLSPEKSALCRMHQHMKNNKQCGGVCGYMNLRIEKLEKEDQQYEKQIDCISRLSLHLVDIQRAQQVEYHFSHLIDKPFEALFKFIHVLPGAFSAYKMKALQPLQQQDSQLMRQYFKSLQDSASRQLVKVQYTTGQAILKILLPDILFYCIYNKSKELSQQQLLYNSNVYLAQDRTLCMGIHQNGYDLSYLPDAQAWVDPIKNLHGLLGQRKRWINGSYFAFQSVKSGFNDFNQTGICLKFQMLYLSFMNTLAFISPALFLFTVHIAMFAFRDWVFNYFLAIVTSDQFSFSSTEFYNSFVYVMDFIYVISMLGLVFKSIHFTHRNQQFIPTVYAISTVMGLFSITVFIVLLYDMIVGIVDSINCMQLVNQVCQVTFLSENPVLRQMFFDQLPGGLTVFMIYKWLIIGMMAMYVVPIVVYSILYCRFQFILDVLFGTISFIFYTPTYLNILNTFALCRIDDISWGTKGLDVEENRNDGLKQSWKSIKILNVAKFVFWNIVVGVSMLIISSPVTFEGITLTPDTYNKAMVAAYVRKFFMTFALMAVLGLSFLIKIILGAIYSFGSRCKKQNVQEVGEDLSQSKIDKNFEEIKQSLMAEVKDLVYDLVRGYEMENKGQVPLQPRKLNSLILASKIMRNSEIRVKNKQKWTNNLKSRSKIIKRKQIPGSTMIRSKLPANSQNILNVNNPFKQKQQDVSSIKYKQFQAEPQVTIQRPLSGGDSATTINIQY